MRRQGQYVDSGGNAYTSAQMQHVPAQRMEVKPGQFQGQLEAFTPERDQPYLAPKSDGQWRWERDGSKVSNPMTPKMFNEGKTVFWTLFLSLHQRPDPNLSLEKQNADLRSRPHDENMEVGHEQNVLPPTLEVLEKKFHDDIMKLAKEQSEAEDAENTRHREKINAINIQYQEQLTALRARHANRRDEFLRKESLARQQQYQQAMMDYYPRTGNNPHGFGSIAGPAAVGDAYRGYNSDNFDSYGERSRFHGGARDQGFEPRGSYQGGHAYDTGSRYY
ncbi:adipocyte plasma membrane-associated protein-like [Hibiscus syriacus]|uniref:Adipocyte plasma membrane-associated protein-like n=1 Tax=Hibiscus syriacus TaxID=106335 RepID=A0A6A3AB92_HIBSY|nr:adipocyte plasma membrane-associated protein-like [Hibiscus syriacus]